MLKKILSWPIDFVDILTKSGKVALTHSEAIERQFGRATIIQAGVGCLMSLLSAAFLINLNITSCFLISAVIWFLGGLINLGHDQIAERTGAGIAFNTLAVCLGFIIGIWVGLIPNLPKLAQFIP
jgi:hypothetical protein